MERQDEREAQFAEDWKRSCTGLACALEKHRTKIL